MACAVTDISRGSLVIVKMKINFIDLEPNWKREKFIFVICCWFLKILLRLKQLSVSLEEWALVGPGIENGFEIVGESAEKTEKRFFITGEKDNFKYTISKFSA